MFKGTEKSPGCKCMNVSGLRLYPIIDSHPTDNQTGFVVCLVCFSFLQTDIAENLSFFSLLLSLFCFLCFVSIYFMFSFISPSVAFFSSVIFLPSVLLSATFPSSLQWFPFHHKRNLEEKRWRSISSASPEALADIVSHPSKGQNWAPEMHTLTMAALLFFCYYMVLHYLLFYPVSLGVKIHLFLFC